MSVSDLEALEAKVADLEARSSELDALMRVALARRGGATCEAVMGDAELLASLDKFGVTEKVSGDVHQELLIAFFEDANAELAENALLTELEDKLKDVPYDDSMKQERTLTVREKLNDVYVGIWTLLGVEETAATKAVTSAGFTAGSDELSQEQKERLNACIDDFQELESKLVGSIVLGREEFAQRMQSRERFQKYEKEIMSKLASLDGNPAGLQAFFMGLQKEAMVVRDKINKMSNEEQLAYLDNPSDEDKESMMKFQVLQMILTGGGGNGEHGHSHDGKPCGGHGHSNAPAPTHSHSHSHGGKECHGHH